MRGAKIVASHSFVKTEVNQLFIQDVLEKFYDLAENATDEIRSQVGDVGVGMFLINEQTLLIGISDSAPIDDKDLSQISNLASEIQKKKQESERIQQDEFRIIAQRLFQQNLYLCFISSNSPDEYDKSGKAVQQAISGTLMDTQNFTYPFMMGPFAVHIAQLEPLEIGSEIWTQIVDKVDLFTIILAPPYTSPRMLEELIPKIRSESEAPIIIVPGSDEYLEKARELEIQFELELCDSVSPNPTDLLISLLPIAGFTDTHGELAKEKWIISHAPKESYPDDESEELGHQAFFVIDKMLGEAKYGYYYEDESLVLSRAPNIIAAISMFQLEATDPTETSVFQAGNLKFAMIERDDLIFTLVTGDRRDIEEIRSKFAFLPDLYLKEPPEPMTDISNLYASPPFTLKLLATLPPEELPIKYIPCRKENPNWDSFTYDIVRSFLETLWNNFDGQRTILDLIPITGSGVALGAIHLLRQLGLIEFRLRILPEDVPRMVGTVDQELTSLYSHLKEIIPKIDGTKSIAEIALEVGVDASVLVTVFSELHKRGVIEL